MHFFYCFFVEKKLSSPWSNEYDPPISDGGILPSSKMRKLEISANDAFDTYREMYVYYDRLSINK
jgi:hypothetical protein